MTIKQLLKEIRSYPTPYQFVQKRLLSGIPWIFSADENSFVKWKTEASKACGVGTEYIYLVGSAKTGFSMSPSKPGQGFRPISPTERWPSDIDIAIVDKALFEAGWNTILSYDRTKGIAKVIQNGPPIPLRERIERMRLNIYWGTLSDAYTISGTETAQRIRSLFSATTRLSPFQGYKPRARIYRRREDLVSYHVQSIEQLLDTLQKKGEDN